MRAPGGLREKGFAPAAKSRRAASFKTGLAAIGGNNPRPKSVLGYPKRVDLRSILCIKKWPAGGSRAPRARLMTRSPQGDAASRFAPKMRAETRRRALGVACSIAVVHGVGRHCGAGGVWVISIARWRLEAWLVTATGRLDAARSG
jgi:hypothetical protein